MLHKKIHEDNDSTFDEVSFSIYTAMFMEANNLLYDFIDGALCLK